MKNNKELVEKVRASLKAKHEKARQEQDETLTVSPIERAKALLKQYEKDIQKKLITPDK